MCDFLVEIAILDIEIQTNFKNSPQQNVPKLCWMRKKTRCKGVHAIERPVYVHLIYMTYMYYLGFWFDLLFKVTEVKVQYDIYFPAAL
jgi:hypothetical protein